MVVGNACRLALDAFHQPIKIDARVGDADYANRRTIPHRAGVEFGDGNIEGGAQAILQTAQHLPFILERLRRFDVKLEGEKSNQGSGQWSSETSVRNGHGSTGY
jgi:hypothetical protein